MDLAAADPHDDLSSTGYCLASRGSRFLVYLPDGGSCTVLLPRGSYRCQWIGPVDGTVTETGIVASKTGGTLFESPLPGDAVLFLEAA
jgi:hypothetical protein